MGSNQNDYRCPIPADAVAFVQFDQPDAPFPYALVIGGPEHEGMCLPELRSGLYGSVLEHRPEVANEADTRFLLRLGEHLCIGGVYIEAYSDEADARANIPVALHPPRWSGKE